MNNTMKEIEDLLAALFREIRELKNKNQSLGIEKHDQLIEFILGIIDTLDSYDRIIETIAEKELDKTNDGSAVLKRFANLSKKLSGLLLKYGVTKLDFPNDRLIVGYCRVI